MILWALGLGFIIGVRHATDADHVVAITTFYNRDQSFKSSALIGVLWGFGHTITVTLIALPIILFSISIPKSLELGFEFIVGLMLVFLGLINLLGVSQRISSKYLPTVHKHSHKDEKGLEHDHIHGHLLGNIGFTAHHLGLFHSLRPVVVGLIHGLAGSAAIALLILSTIKDPLFSLFYLLVFHLGVISGMIVITSFLGISLAFAKSRSKKIHKYLVFASGVLSIVFGFLLMYETGFEEGFF